jgi:hypothetical protein
LCLEADWIADVASVVCVVLEDAEFLPQGIANLLRAIIDLDVLEKSFTQNTKAANEIRATVSACPWRMTF